jgi:hypothetical protein
VESVSGSEFDFEIQLPYGEDSEHRLAAILAELGTRVEVKREPACSDTGNLFVEFKQSDGCGGEKPSGIHPDSTTADWWAVEFLPNRWVVIATDELRAIARDEWYLSGARPGGDNGNWGVLVPIERLLEKHNALGDPAAVLAVLVQANTPDANRALRDTQARLKEAA